MAKHYWLGKRRSEETKRKISEKLIGKRYSHKKPMSLEHKKALSIAHKGQVSYMKGKKHTKETIKKISGLNSVHYKGDNAKYYAIHIHIRKYFGKASKCENPDCVYPRKKYNGKIMLKVEKYEWALKHGREYTRNIEDYYQLCHSCHQKYDKRKTLLSL